MTEVMQRDNITLREKEKERRKKKKHNSFAHNSPVERNREEK